MAPEEVPSDEREGDGSSPSQIGDPAWPGSIGDYELKQASWRECSGQSYLEPAGQTNSSARV